MSQFFSKLDYVPSKETPGKFALIVALIYGSTCAKQTFVVNEGFETDLVTGRKWLVIRRIVQSKMEPAAVVHDYLYDSKTVPRKLADEVFYEAMLVCGVAKWRAWAAWAGVRCFGSSFYAS